MWGEELKNSAPVSPPLCTSLLRARWARARDLVSGFVVMAKARLAQRPVARAVRADTLLSTEPLPHSAGAASSTPRLMSAARVGPVVYGLLLTFRGDGYG